jgi:hypothetical protein
MEKLNRSKSLFFEKIDKPLARLTKKNTQIIKVQDENVAITTNITEIRIAMNRRIRIL